VRVLLRLRENLDAKARRKPKRGDALATIFLLNNYHYIHKTVQNGGLKSTTFIRFLAVDVSCFFSCVLMVFIFFV
jgi:hypothetical protein